MSRKKKELLKRGSLFVPLIFSFGAVLEDMPIGEFLRDPTKISNTLRVIQNFFQVDGVICYADNTVLAEALGCRLLEETYPAAVEPLQEWQDNLETLLTNLPSSARATTVLEVTKRLNILLPDCILLGLVTGPLTLASQLTGKPVSEVLDPPEVLGFATKASLAFTKALGDAGVDILLMAETALPHLSDDSIRVIGRCYSPIWNTAKFYDLCPLLMIEDLLVEHVKPLQRLVDGLIFPAKKGPELWQKAKRISLALPVSLLENEPQEIESFLRATGIDEARSSSRGLLLVTTEREVPENINKEFMIRGIKTIQAYLST